LYGIVTIVVGKRGRRNKHHMTLLTSIHIYKHIFFWFFVFLINQRSRSKLLIFLFSLIAFRIRIEVSPSVYTQINEIYQRNYLCVLEQDEEKNERKRQERRRIPSLQEKEKLSSSLKRLFLRLLVIMFVHDL